ncbi:MAG: protein translocase subunit SecF, partial [Campylobacteraceae bacterium]|nr:protein translocase subunit SecF [Campylobacteraceae bacterium]
MQIFSSDKIYGFMKLSPITLLISLLLLVGSYGLVLTKGLNYGIDFSGGTIIQVQYDKPVDLDKVREAINQDELFKDATVTRFGSNEEIVIRFSSSTASLEEDVEDIAREHLQSTGNFEVRRVDMVGPKVGDELRSKGAMALIISIIAILAYIAFRFEWRFAVAAVLALVHDISIVVGALVLFKVDVNLDILAALLTILGYSLN